MLVRKCIKPVDKQILFLLFTHRLQSIFATCCFDCVSFATCCSRCHQNLALLVVPFVMTRLSKHGNISNIEFELTDF